MNEVIILEFLGANVVFFLLAALVIVSIFLGVRIVSQSEKHIVERFGRLHSVLGPGINLLVPFLDKIAHKISILERQLPTAEQDAITADNVLVKVETSVFYRITEPEKLFIEFAMSMPLLLLRLLVLFGAKLARWNSTKFNQTAMT